MGRFSTVDPIRDGRNWYVYTANDPINKIDRFGLEVHKVSVGVRIAVVLGFNVEVGRVWDNEGNSGWFFTVGVGVGVDVGIGPVGGEVSTNEKVAKIEDIEGVSTDTKAGVVVGMSYNLETNKIDGVGGLGLGG